MVRDVHDYSPGSSGAIKTQEEIIKEAYRIFVQENLARDNIPYSYIVTFFERLFAAESGRKA